MPKLITRRDLLKGTAAGLAVGVGGGLAAGMSTPALAKIGPNGLHQQDWFVESFLNLADDVAEAAENGKNLAVFWEMRGCPYCKQVHEVNFKNDKVLSYIKENFSILQLDFYGNRSVTDFDGTELGESKMARRWGVNFTPTFCFYPMDQAKLAGKFGRKAEAARMPGYFKPFHFLTMFEFVREKAYEKQDFQRFLSAKIDRLKASGQDVDVW